MTTMTTRHPVAVATPPGAVWAADAWIAVARLGTRLQSWLQSWLHQRRERAAVTGRRSDANRLRDVAQGFMSNDPRFAADLFAAADRHERAQ